MAYDWKTRRSDNTNTRVALRRAQSKNTPWADFIDLRREAEGNTPIADWYGYSGPPTVTDDTTLTAKEACAQREGYHWEPTMAGGGACIPNDPYTPEPGPSDPGDEIPPEYIPTPLDGEDLNVTEDTTPVPYTQLGAYSDAFQQMLNGPAFGNQTLEELENARVAALQGDLENQYGRQANDMTQRLNLAAGSQGMFNSGARTGAIASGLGELGQQQMTELAKGSAEIRGERPELLLQEREQRANIANMWGQMDLASQEANLNAMLDNKLMEYTRELQNGKLTIDAFNGNVNQMGLFFDYVISNAKNNNDLALITANINEIYNGMDDADKNRLIELIQSLMGAYGGMIGGG